MVLIPPDPPAVIEVAPEGSHWRLSSSDQLFSGWFMDRRTACRYAQAEAETHPGHVVIIRETCDFPLP